MVVVLEVAGGARRGWFRRRKRGAEMERIPVGEGCFYRITAHPDKKGHLPWEAIQRLAEQGAERMLLPPGVEPPADMGIRPFRGHLLRQDLMAATAIRLLKKNRTDSRRAAVVLYDPRGCMPWLACALLPYTADMQVVTSRLDLYAEQEEIAMEEYGASFWMTEDIAPLRRAALVLAPEGLRGLQAAVPGLVLSGMPERGRHVAEGYVLRHQAAWLEAKPAWCSNWRFLSAMYEWGGLRDPSMTSPAALIFQGRPVSLGSICLYGEGFTVEAVN